MATGTCENCGDTECDLTEVHRVYLPFRENPENGPGLEEPVVMDELELWCFACCTQFPHQRND